LSGWGDGGAGVKIPPCCINNIEKSITPITLLTTNAMEEGVYGKCLRQRISREQRKKLIYMKANEGWHGQDRS